jgi:RNA polymerase sigma-70 factor, ECF subfamily
MDRTIGTSATETETFTWIRRSQAGDGEAFAELFHQYKNLVYKTAFLMLGNPSEAEDMLQEVFLEVHRSLSDYDPARGAFTTWLYRITVNDCLNWRRKRRPKLIPLDVLPAGGAHHAALMHEDATSDEGVWQALSKLNPKLRTVVVLRYYWDLSYVEITEILNIPIGTVKSRLNRALLTLRDELDRRGDDAFAPAIGAAGRPDNLERRLAG